MLCLKEVAPLVRHSVAYCQSMLKSGRFPIRHERVGRHYRFTVADVSAFVERGERTNGKAPQHPTRRRTFFNKARRAA
jgi:excisionase family DNA binding protein